jgi:hypothetical protein
MAIQFEKIRKDPTTRLDERFRILKQELDVAWYKNWKFEKSYDFLGFDALATVKLSQDQFQGLHTTIDDFYRLIFHTLNQEHPEPEPERKYRYSYDDLGAIRRDRYGLSKARVLEPSNKRYADAVLDRLKILFGRDFTWP